MRRTKEEGAAEEIEKEVKGEEGGKERRGRE